MSSIYQPRITAYKFRLYEERVLDERCYRCGVKVEEINPRTNQKFTQCQKHREQSRKWSYEFKKRRKEKRNNKRKLCKA